MDVALVIEALNLALGHRKLAPELVLLHVFHFSQYRATNSGDLLRKHGIVFSMIANGCCWVNAVVECFFFSLEL